MERPRIWCQRLEVEEQELAVGGSPREVQAPQHERGRALRAALGCARRCLVARPMFSFLGQGALGCGLWSARKGATKAGRLWPW